MADSLRDLVQQMVTDAPPQCVAEFHALASGGAWGPIPPWARFLAQVGERLGQLDPSDQSITVGISIPQRGYAAALVGTGLVLARERSEPLDPGDPVAHFDRLCSLPAGSSVKYFMGKKVNNGRVIGPVQRDGHRFLTLQLRAMTAYIPVKSALKVRVGEAEAEERMGSKTIKVPPLLERVLGTAQAVSFLTAWRADCLIVGTKTQLQEDFRAEVFSAGDDSHSGSLSDLACVTEDPQNGRRFRCVLASGSGDPDQIALPEAPRAVIFDGGAAYARWHDAWPESHHIALIDRGQAAAEEAVGVFSERFVKRAANSNALDGLQLPPSIEYSEFQDRR
jgi:hypothetical protein